MGCYGIGSSRLNGAIVEVSNDQNEIIWPEQVAPYDVHLISLARTDDEKAKADAIYQALQDQGREVLYDDRESTRAVIKFS